MNWVSIATPPTEAGDYLLWNDDYWNWARFNGEDSTVFDKCSFWMLIVPPEKKSK